MKYLKNVLRYLRKKFIDAFIDYNYLENKINDRKLTTNLNQVSLGANSCLYHESRVLNMIKDKNRILIGENTHIRGQLVVFKSGGKIQIGNNCYIGEDSRIWSQQEIIVGNNVLIAHNVNIHDTNSHPINYLDRRDDFQKIINEGFSETNKNIDCKKIIINDDVWIGFNAIILKGVEIGERTIVASGSVVTNNIPSDVIVAGNPAQIIKNLKNDKSNPKTF